MDSTHALFLARDMQVADKLEAALKEYAPAAYTPGEPVVIREKLLNNATVTFASAGERVPGTRHFYVTVDSESSGVAEEIELVGLPLQPTPYCTTMLIGCAEDMLGYQPLVQLGLQFSGAYESADFPVRVAARY